MFNEAGWLILFYLVMIILAIVLAPIVIPESWILRYHAMNFSYLVCSFCLTMFSLLAFKIISAERCLRFSRFVSQVWIELMGWDLRSSRGVEILEETDNAVVVVNHQSFYDVFCFLPIWSRVSPYFVVFAGSELKDYFFIGRGIQKVESVHYLTRGNAREAMNTLITDSANHFKCNQKNKILIFPEGTRNLRIRSNGWKFAEFKHGAFRVAKTLNVPIIPVVISPFYFIDHERHYFARGKSTLSVLDPIYPGDESVEKLAEKVKNIMQEEFLKQLEERDGQSKRAMSTSNFHIDPIHR